MQQQKLISLNMGSLIQEQIDKEMIMKLRQLHLLKMKVDKTCLLVCQE